MLLLLLYYIREVDTSFVATPPETPHTAKEVESEFILTDDGQE